MISISGATLNLGSVKESKQKTSNEPKNNQNNSTTLLESQPSLVTFFHFFLKIQNSTTAYTSSPSDNEGNRSMGLPCHHTLQIILHPVTIHGYPSNIGINR
jgi:hypothetical protein